MKSQSLTQRVLSLMLAAVIFVSPALAQSPAGTTTAPPQTATDPAQAPAQSPSTTDPAAEPAQTDADQADTDAAETDTQAPATQAPLPNAPSATPENAPATTPANVPGTGDATSQQPATGTTETQAAPAQQPTTVVAPPAPRGQLKDPLGTATAEKGRTVGGGASRPAGSAIAPAKQRTSRSLLIKIGAVAAAGAALGIVYGLSRSSGPVPPGAR